MESKYPGDTGQAIQDDLLRVSEEQGEDGQFVIHIHTEGMLQNIHPAALHTTQIVEVQISRGEDGLVQMTGFDDKHHAYTPFPLPFSCIPLEEAQKNIRRIFADRLRVYISNNAIVYTTEGFTSDDFSDVPSCNVTHLVLPEDTHSEKRILVSYIRGLYQRWEPV